MNHAQTVLDLFRAVLAAGAALACLFAAAGRIRTLLLMRRFWREERWRPEPELLADPRCDPERVLGAVGLGGGILCVECLPEEEPLEGLTVVRFLGERIAHPVCDKCGHTHGAKELL